VSYVRSTLLSICPRFAAIGYWAHVTAECERDSSDGPDSVLVPARSCTELAERIDHKGSSILPRRLL
jgi:hypothetical protein